VSDKPVRVLHIVSIMDRGGIETFLMNIYRKIDRSKVQFDFLVTREQSGIFDEEIILLGGKIYNIPYIKKIGLLKYIKNIKFFFQKHYEYKIVHCHMDTWAGLFLSVAKVCNISVRISHSHSTKIGQRPDNINGYIEFIFKGLMKLFIKTSGTHFFACGYDAGVWLYGKNLSDRKLIIIKNGVDTDEIRYNKEIAEKVRRDLAIDENTMVMGHVGSMGIPKNHEFLIDVFDAVHKHRPDSILCLVGDGKLRAHIEEYVQLRGLNHKVRFLGIRGDVYNLLKAFDVFVMPSLYEGFPVAAVEAQAAALPCILSDRITDEVDMGMGLVKFVSLDKSPEYWSDAILQERSVARTMAIDNLIELGYDSHVTANWLENFYINLIE